MMAETAYRLAEWLARHLPSRVAEALAGLVARLAFVLRAPARIALESNLSAFDRRPRAVRRLARAAFQNFARTFVEFLGLERMTREALIEAVEVRGEEHLRRAYRAGRGVIVLSVHLGNWEWGAAALAARGHRMHVAARRHERPAIEAMFERRRRAFGLRRLAGRVLWPEAARLLRRRQCVALMGDRIAPGTRHSVCAWAGALARRTGAIVLPAVTLRRGRGRYVVIVDPPLSPDACASGGFRAAMRRHLARHLSEWCAFEPLPDGLA